MDARHVLLGGILSLSALALGATIVTPQAPSILPTVPGAINQAITQENIGATICNPNWHTSSIRPPSSYTTALKIKQLKQYGWSDQNTGDYEEDHLISLEIGGNPTDPNNLWPEKYAEPDGARDKDKIENRCHAAVCAHQITLVEAQKEITRDWRTACQI